MTISTTAAPCLLGRDNGGYPIQTSDIALPFPNLTQTFELTQNMVTTVTVPAQPATRMYAKIKYTANIDVWVEGDALHTAAVPSTSIGVGTQELCPESRIVSQGQTIQFITGSATACWVSISYWMLPSNN
jgi:hypothetical protein